MKKYCLFLLLLFAACSARAQVVTGDVTVARKALYVAQGKLHMELEITVGRKAVTRSQSWTIIPELSTADRKALKLFPHVAVYGKYQQHMIERRRVLSGAYWAERKPYKEIFPDGKTDQVIRYVMEIPYESWMDNASLVVRQVQNTPGGKLRVFSIDVNGAVDKQHILN